jgi:cytoskeletal protein CcmA (bactofilin family)
MAATMSATGAKTIPFSVLGSDVHITGNIEATVDLHIDGRVEGDIACAALVMGQDAQVSGRITARTARVAGTVKGGIDAEELVIESTARVTGDVTYEKLTIEPGGQIDGRFTHKSALAPTELKLIAIE